MNKKPLSGRINEREDTVPCWLIKKGAYMRKYNLSKIMLKAWKIYRQNREKGISFGESLHRAWLSAKAEEINAKRVEAAKQAAGIAEQTETYSKWKELGYEVLHGSKALFGVSLIWGSRGDNKEYQARFFGASQVQPIIAQEA